MAAVSAASGAVSQRKMRGPSPTATAPAAAACRASSGQKPPSLPVISARRYTLPGCNSARSGAPPPS